jgi:hypothetical protein
MLQTLALFSPQLDALYKSPSPFFVYLLLSRSVTMELAMLLAIFATITSVYHDDIKPKPLGDKLLNVHN